MKRLRIAQSLFLVLFLAQLPLFSEEVRNPAQEEVQPYIQGITPDILDLLPPNPADGSPEQKAELAMLRHVSATRTKREIAVARSQVDFSFFSYAVIVGPWFKKESLPRTHALFKRVEKTTKGITNKGKRHWKRARPYDADPTVKVLEKERSLSYPSGHSTRGMVYACVLAELFPEKRDALMDFGFNAGWNRIVANVHYPSDVNAGRTLGLAIARELLLNEAFRKDLEEARTEIRALTKKE